MEVTIRSPIQQTACVAPPFRPRFRPLGTPMEECQERVAAQGDYFGTQPNFWRWKRQYKRTVPQRRLTPPPLHRVSGP